MPEPPISTPNPDRRVSRNLFVEADPYLDALAQSTADERGRSAGGRRRGHGLVVLAEQHRPPHSTRADDAEHFTCSKGNLARLRAAARHSIGQADAAAGRLLRDVVATPYRALVTIVALALLLVAVSWLALDVRRVTATAPAAADAQLARDAATLRHQRVRIEALTAELRELTRSAPPVKASTAPPRPSDVRRQPAAPKPPTARRPLRRHP